MLHATCESSRSGASFLAHAAGYLAESLPVLPILPVLSNERVVKSAETVRTNGCVCCSLGPFRIMLAHADLVTRFIAH